MTSQAGTAPSEETTPHRNRVQPTVSVVIFGQHGPLLRETIKNLAAQSLSPVEILLTGPEENGGTDSQPSGKIQIQSLTKDSSETAEVHPTVPFGSASGEYIQFLNTGDLLDIDKIETQALALQRTGAAFAHGPWIPVLAKPLHEITRNRVYGTGAVDTTSGLIYEALLDGAFAIQGCLVRRSALEEAESPDKEHQSCMTTILRALQKSPQFCHTATTLALCAKEADESNASLFTQDEFLAAAVKESMHDGSSPHRSDLLAVLFRLEQTEEKPKLCSALRQSLQPTTKERGRWKIARPVQRRHSKRGTELSNPQIRQIEEIGFVLS